MKASTLFLLCVLCTITNAQPTLYREPLGCAAPQRLPKCLFSTPTKYFGTCAIYERGSCSTYCVRLMAPHVRSQTRSCYEGKPRARTLLELFQKCYSSCRSVKGAISNYRRQGKSDVRALIYLAADHLESISAKSLVYQKTSTPLRTRICRRINGLTVCKQLNRCICSACWKAKAKCPGCCRYAGYLYV